ncbi:MAG: hypothetical protein M3O50_21400 [Myxococcota bacterium]|nr:hypothetical protein [Myxococcota bacterium]
MSVDADIARIRSVLKEADSYLERIPATQPGAGELTMRLAAYRRTLDDWLVDPPTEDEVRALVERVTEARRLAVMTAPTVSFHTRK